MENENGQRAMDAQEKTTAEMVRHKAVQANKIENLAERADKLSELNTMMVGVVTDLCEEYEEEKITSKEFYTSLKDATEVHLLILLFLVDAEKEIGV